jgi:hypothetical protein
MSRQIAAFVSVVLPCVVVAAAQSGRTSIVQRPDQSVAQLFAVRGEISRITPTGKDLTITVRPDQGFEPVTVTAGENDPVGAAVGVHNGTDLLDLLLGEESEDEGAITAAELKRGDAVSIIYDPKSKNRALEIYLR